MEKPRNIKQTVNRILDLHNMDMGLLVSMLQDIQEEYHYLPRKALEEVSYRLDIPLSQVYGVATFFRAFSLKPRGRMLLQVCLGTACHVRGGPLVLEKMERELGIKSGENTPDLKFTLETVNCVGACALGPIIICNDDYHAHITTVKAVSLLKKLKKTVKE